MAKKVKGRLADDIRASLQEVLKYARGEKTEVIMRRVVLSDSAAPRAMPGANSVCRCALASFKTEPKARVTRQRRTDHYLY
jgi:hypothetical protein